MNESKTKYFFRFAAHHVARAGTPEKWQRFFRAVESQDHFDRQAEHFGSFKQTSEDLESHCLPAIVKLRDWDRFVHYGLIAANLRGLSEALAEEDVLEPLTRHGRLDLAESLVDRLPDPAARARARAVIAGALDRDRPAFDRLRDGLLRDLDSARTPGDREAAEAWCETLETAARLARELRRRWAPWIDHLAAWPHLAVRVRKAVAEGLIENGALEDPQLWQAVAAVDDAGYLLVGLPRRLAETGPDEPGRLLERIRRLEPDGELIAWSTRAAVAGRFPAREATALWQRAANDWGPIPWSLELVEAGRELWSKLAPEHFEKLVARIDATVGAALRVARLEQLSNDRADGSAALTAIDRIPFPPQRLHWSLCYLATGPDGAAGLEGQVVAAGDYLARRRYAAAAGDLCRFLDLVAAVFPRRLRLEVQNVLWAPDSRAETLRTLAREGRSPGLLEELFERVERYASTVAANEAEGFELRLEVLVTLTRRLCAMRQELCTLDEAVQRLLPEEKDTLRAAVAEEMAAIGRADLARAAGRPIRPGRLRRRTRLATATEAELEELLAPGALYLAVADVGAVEDEHRALAALLEAPVDPGRSARRRFEAIRDKGREIQALVDLAWHTLAFQKRRLDRRRQDRLAALVPLKQALGVVESDAWLVASTPELAALGSRLGTTQALAELREASEKIVSHASVPWPRREAALEFLLAKLGCFFSGSDGDLSAAQCRAAAAFLEWLAELPRALGDTPGAAEIQRHWHRVLPRIVAALERLPSRVAGHLRHPWRTRLGLEPPASDESSTTGRSLERFRGAWGDLQPAQEGTLELCFACPEERLRSADVIAIEPEPDPDILHALIYLLAAEAPERVPALVKRLPPGVERDRLILRWIRCGWAPAQDCRLFGLLGPEHAGLGKAWHGLHDDLVDEGTWVADICAVIARAELDPSDPQTSELRRRLWRLDRRHLPELATAAIGALASGGREGGERGLRLFLNALVAPRLGEAASDRQRGGLESIALAATRALSLAAQDDGEDELELENAESRGSPERADIYKRWKRAWSNRSMKILAPDEDLSKAINISMLLGLALFPSLTYFDGRLLVSGSEGSMASPGGSVSIQGVSMQSVLAMLLGTWIVNAWALGSSLSLQTAGELGISRPVRHMRTMLVGLPLLGLWVLPAWRRCQEHARCRRYLFSPHRASKAFLSLSKTEPLKFSGTWFLRDQLNNVKWATRIVGFVCLYIGNLSVVSLSSRILAAKATASGFWLNLVAALSGVLHVVAGCGMAYFFHQRVREKQAPGLVAAALLSLPLLWLIPWPWLPLLGLFLMFLN